MGFDVIVPITPKPFVNYSYILVETDYFYKWVQPIPLREVKKESVIDFIQAHIIYWNGVPGYIINNGKPFVNKLVIDLYEKFKFVQHTSSMYNAPTNGLAKAFNKTIYNLLSKVVAKSKQDWHDKLERLFGYAKLCIRCQLN